MTDKEKNALEEDPTAFWWAFIWTVIYGILFFPLLLFIGVWGILAFEDGISWTMLISALINLCIPLSFLISIYLTWKYYNHGKYDMTYFAWGLPWIVLATLLIVSYLISSLQMLWNDLMAR